MPIEQPLREQLYIQEILVWIPDNRFDYAIVAMPLTNTTGAERTIEDVIGLPINESSGSYLMVLNANVANIDGIVVGVCDGSDQTLTLANNATSEGKYFILVDGPAIINQDKIHTADPAGTNYTMATVLTSLLAKKIKTNAEPQFQETITP